MSRQREVDPRLVEMVTPHTLTHVIPGREIMAEETRLAAALRAGGIDPVGLRLDQPATDVKLRDLERKARAINARVVSRAWVTNRNGDVEVVLGFPTEGQALAVRCAL